MKNSNNENNIENNNEIDIIISERKNKGKVILNVFICAFLCLIFAISLLNIFAEDKEYSEKENRVLSSFPVFSSATVFEGSFMKEFETYLMDQFVFRDQLMSLKTLTERVLGKKEINGVYAGADGYLFAEPEQYNKKLIQEITSAVSEFAEKHDEMKHAVMIAPDSGYTYADKLPSFAEYPDQKAQLKQIKNSITNESVQWINLLSAFSDADGAQLYYKTDHHWTTRGAYEAFKVLAKKWKLNTEDVKYKFYPVADDFMGTLSSRTGIENSADTVEICVPAKNENSYVVFYDSLQKKTATFFEKAKLDERNKYEVFLGGNFDKITITTVSQSKDTLLLIKDSYANCMVPMLTPYFNKIVVIDPRYLTEGLEKIIEETEFSHVLFLYNLNTLLGDTSLASCLNS